MSSRGRRQSLAGPASVFRQAGARLFHQGLEGLGLAHRKIGQDLAVDGDTGLRQAMHEFGIGQVMGTDGGVDTLNPQRPEIALARAPVAISILQALFDALNGDAKIRMPPSAIAAGAGQNFFVAGMGSDAPFDSCYGRISLNVRHPALYRRYVGFVHQADAAVAAAHFLGLFR